MILQPVLVNNGNGDEDGRLVLSDGRLVAVMVLLSDPAQGALVGRWFIEAAFGPCAEAVGLLFDSLDAAIAWFGRRLGATSPP